jgi:hypothetical protein
VEIPSLPLLPPSPTFHGSPGREQTIGGVVVSSTTRNADLDDWFPQIQAALRVAVSVRSASPTECGHTIGGKIRRYGKRLSQSWRQETWASQEQSRPAPTSSNGWNGIRLEGAPKVGAIPPHHPFGSCYSLRLPLSSRRLEPGAASLRLMTKNLQHLDSKEKSSVPIFLKNSSQ